MPGIGRVDALVAESGAGIVTEMPDDPAARAAAADRVHALLRDHQATMRERALELCRREFVWSSYVPRIRAAYRRALRGDAPALRVPSPPTLHTARGDARA
jgi:hypothetical protein